MTVRGRQIILLCTILSLFCLSVWASYSLGHQSKMYSNPVYRWRQSMAVALSRMQNKPLHGYLAYRSIVNYFAQHGLPIWRSEAKTIPTAQQTKQLVTDPARIQALIVGASKAPINFNLKPDIIKGNEKGLADFYYIAFTLFGISIASFVILYYLMLFISTILFTYSFRDSPFCLFLLSLYLIGHFYMVEFYSALEGLNVVHNSRFFPVLSLLPAMHLALLALRRTRPSFGQIVAAALQTFLLMFIMFCRAQAAWQAFAVLALPVLLISPTMLLRALRQFLTRPISRRSRAYARRLIIATWPSMLVLIGLIGYVAYPTFAFNRTYYAADSTTHVFWHNLYSGTVSSSPALMKLYSFAARPNTDQLSYNGVMHELNARKDELLKNRKDPAWAIAFQHQGKLYISPEKAMGVYDRLVRGIFFKLVRAHPWLALQSFLIGKPEQQIEAFAYTSLARPITYVPILILALATSILAVLLNIRPSNRGEFVLAAKAIIFIAAFAAIPTLIFPSVLIVGTVLFLLMAFMIGAIFLPVVFAAEYMRPNLAAAH